MTLFLLLLIAAIVLGFLGVLLKGLLYLLFIGIAVFIVALLVGGFRVGRGRRKVTR